MLWAVSISPLALQSYIILADSSVNRFFAVAYIMVAVVFITDNNSLAAGWLCAVAPMLFNGSEPFATWLSFIDMC